MKKALIVLFLFGNVRGVFGSAALLEGDIVFQSQSGSRFSRAIQLATHSPYNHMGMVFIRKGKFYVLEAVQPVRFTTLDRWIENGDGDHFVAKRLKNAKTILTPEVLRKMEALAPNYLGKKYSATFLWSDECFYCSGLVWKIYQKTTGLELGEFQELKDFDLSSPLVQKELRRNYGRFVPMSHTVISPAQIFKSDLLCIVASK